MDQLQKGVKANVVVAGLLRLYLVVATENRVLAYRHYREQRSDYWTSEKLAQSHRGILYGLVPDQLTSRKRWGIKFAQKKVVAVRTSFCEAVSLAEELVP